MSQLPPPSVNANMAVIGALPPAQISDKLSRHIVTSLEELEAALIRQSSQPYAKLGTVLLREGLATKAQVRAALTQQRPGMRLGELLMSQSIIGVADLNRALAIQMGIPRVDPRRFKAAVEAIRLVPEKLATLLKAMPLCVLHCKLIVAMANPLDRAPLEELRFHSGMYAEPVLAPEEDIAWAIERYYGGNIDLLASVLNDSNTEADDLAQELSESDNTLVKFVNRMILDAYEQHASDIHIEPYPGRRKSLIRFRKDGTLVNYAELPFNYRNAVVARVKVMCGLDISERRRPQDGKIDFSKFGPAKIELRVATLPTAGGLEDVVMRILAGSKPLPLDALLLSPYNLGNLKALTAKPYGLFLVCGPTGSGKTTTLHSVLGHLNTSERKIWTAEDPVEITQAGLRQVQVKPKIGLTFAACMRAFLRADPDIIMVGEMRDEETAATAIEASLTGHLVLSTLHTNSAPESVVRLLDMGMNPFNFSDALLGVLAQRLAKRLCLACKESHEVTYEELEPLFFEYTAEIVSPDAHPDQIEGLRHTVLEEWRERHGDSDKLTLYRAKGCEACEHSGYLGRVALHELLVATPRIKRLIMERATVPDLLLAAYGEGMRTLKQDGIEKCFQGHTDIRQVRAVCVK